MELDCGHLGVEDVETEHFIESFCSEMRDMVSDKGRLSVLKNFLAFLIDHLDASTSKDMVKIARALYHELRS